MLSMLALSLAAVAPAPQDALHVDEDYRFRIVSGRPDGTVLDTEAAQRLAPDAVAMLMTEGTTAVGVIPEYSPDTDLAEYTALVVDGLSALPGVADFDASPPATTEHDGRPAAEATATFALDGVPSRYYCRVYGNGDFVFQLLAFTSEGDVDSEDLAALVDRFEVLPGEVVGRRSTLRTVDADGVGWRVRDGVFESAIVDARLEAREPWRIVTGAELDGMDEVADVGLVTTGPDGYCTITIYPDDGIWEDGYTPADYAEDIASDWELGSDVERDGEPVELEVLGGTLRLDSFREGHGAPFRVLHGAIAVDGDVVEVTAWAPLDLADAALGGLGDALAGLAFLGADEQAALTAELLSSPDPEGRVGTGHSLRGGVYRDFEFGFVLRKPDTLWTFTTGVDAQSLREGLRVVGGHVLEPIGFEVEILQWGEDDLASAHLSSLVDEWSAFESLADVPTPVAIDVDGIPALFTDVVSDGAGPDDPSNVDMRLVTALVEGHRLGVGISSYGADPESFERAAQALVEGLTFPESGFRETVVTPTSFEDRRLGFTLRSPQESWEGQPVPLPDELLAVMSGYRWSCPHGRAVFLIALGHGDDVNSASIASALMARIVADQGGAQTRTTRTLLGEEAEVLLTRRLFSRGAFVTFSRAGRVFIAGSTGGGDTEELLQRLEAAIEIDG